MKAYKPMTVAAFTKALEKHSMTNDHLAMVMGVHPRTVYRWAAGDVPIPKTVWMLLTLLPTETLRASMTKP